MITRAQVIGRLGVYFGHRLTLAALVDWAERAMMEGLRGRHHGTGGRRSPRAKIESPCPTSLQGAEIWSGGLLSERGGEVVLVEVDGGGDCCFPRAAGALGS
jgi:hypothetical protein